MNEDDISCKIDKQLVKLDISCYIESTILDLSNILIYDNFYTLKNRYKDNLRLIYIDTDGFVSNIRHNKDVYKDMSENNMFDMSCYDESMNYKMVIMRWVKKR